MTNGVCQAVIDCVLSLAWLYLKPQWFIISNPEQYTAVQAVLVEEEEDEEEQADPEPSVENTEPSLNMEEGEEGSASDSDSLSVQEPVAEEQEKEDQSDDSQASAKPVLVELSEEDEEPAVTGEVLCFVSCTGLSDLYKFKKGKIQQLNEKKSEELYV